MAPTRSRGCVSRLSALPIFFSAPDAGDGADFVRLFTSVSPGYADCGHIRYICESLFWGHNMLKFAVVLFITFKVYKVLWRKHRFWSSFLAFVIWWFLAAFCVPLRAAYLGLSHVSLPKPLVQFGTLGGSSRMPITRHQPCSPLP
jgi:hypothetical protein